MKGKMVDWKHGGSAGALPFYGAFVRLPGICKGFVEKT